MADAQELLDCSICLHLLEDPVTTTCGHSFCMKCINTFWDSNTRGRGYSCPQCREPFRQRPVLRRNTLLAALLEEHRRLSSQNTDGDTYAAPGDIQCDVCTERKRKATTFCLVCLASYCKTHLKPHFEVPPLRRHNLVQASARIKDSICSRHFKLVEIYCRTDQQFICLLCMVEKHKDHDTVAVDAERCLVQERLEQIKQEIAERLPISERKMTELRQAADSIRDAAWETCDDFERLCAEHIRLYVCSVERRCSEMREKVEEAQKAGVDWTSSRLAVLRREELQLRRREEELNRLSLMEDPVQFLQGFWALGDLPVFKDSPEMVTQFVTAQKIKLKNMSDNEKTKLSSKHEEKSLSTLPRLREKMMTSRKYLLTLSQNFNVEVDPNTVAACLCLSDREISWSDRDQAHPDHPDRFTYYHQALCQRGLDGCHYWEVEWDGGIVELAVSYRGIQRKGSGRDSCFGHNNLSWKLTCSSSGCTFWHNNLHKGQIPLVLSHRVGVHLNCTEGKLGFYSVSEPFKTLTLLHQIQTIFTEPLYPGFSVDLGATLKISEPNS